MVTETKQPEARVEQGIEAIASRTVAQPLIDLRDQPSPDILRVLAIGAPPVVDDCVVTLYRLGYARPEEWSRQLPTMNPGEVMRILTKRVMAVE